MIENNLYIINTSVNINSCMYDITVITGVNLYSLLIRIIISYICNKAPIIFLFVIFAVLLYLFFKYSGPNRYIQGHTALQSSPPLQPSAAFILGTAIWSSVDNCPSKDINPNTNLSIVQYNVATGQALYRDPLVYNSTISNKYTQLRSRSNILKLLERINIPNNVFYKEYSESEYIGIDTTDSTVIA